MTQPAWKTEKKRRQKKARKQEKKANTRAKYGPRMKPAPVTIRSMIDFEVVEVLDQSALTGWKR